MTQSTYQAPTVSTLINQLTPPSSDLSNIAKGIWLKEQVAEAIIENCTSTFFDVIEQAIEALPKGVEKIERTLPNGQVVKGERNARQGAKKSLTTAFKNAVKDWKENDKDLFEKYSNVNLSFNKSQPLFKYKATPATYEEKLFKSLCECLTEKDAHMVVNETLRTYGKAYWERKRSIVSAQLERDIERIANQYGEYLGMGMSEDTAQAACEDIFGVELARQAIN